MEPAHVVALGSVIAVHVLAMISPGPNVLVVTRTALGESRRAGVLAALGIAFGTLLWTTAALFGLVVLFTRLPWLYSALTIVGGAYLMLLGTRLWRHAEHDPFADAAAHSGTRHSGAQAFRLGMLTNLTNPKALVFFGGVFAALLPPEPPLALRLASIGTLTLNAALWHVALACFFSTARAHAVYGRVKRWVDRLAGTALFALGVRLVMPLFGL